MKRNPITKIVPLFLVLALLPLAAQVKTKQYQEMARLAEVVQALGPRLGVPVHVEIESQSYAPHFDSLFWLTVVNNEKETKVFGAHLMVWGWKARRAGWNFWDYAAKGVFQNFIPQLGQSKWRKILKGAGFKNGKLPKNWPE